MKSAAAIAFDYRPSRLLLAAIALVCGLALVAIALSAAGFALQAVLALGALGYAAFSARRCWRGETRRAAWHEAGHWRIVDARGESHVAELAHATVRGNWIVLGLRRSDGVRVVLMLAPDNSDAETRRRLRVRLARHAKEDQPAPV